MRGHAKRNCYTSAYIFNAANKSMKLRSLGAAPGRFSRQLELPTCIPRFTPLPNEEGCTVGL